MTKHILLTFTLLMAVPVITMAKTEQFQMKKFVTEASSETDVMEGLTRLYKNNISSPDLRLRTKESLEFQNFVRGTLNSAISTNPMVQVEVSEKILTGNFVKETTIKFPSLIQRPNNHASNMMIAKIYEPSNQDKNCEFKYPTTIMLHHILNEVGVIEDAGKVISSGVLNRPSIVVVIQMPHYAQRRQMTPKVEEFLNSDLASFRKNMAQLILDVHLLKNYIETRPNIDTHHISLSGFSLGAVMGLTIGAFDQSFNSYGFLVGGSDMANILMNRATANPKSEVAIALKDLPQDENFIRDQIAAVDSTTWMKRYHNKSFFFLSASHDDVINYQNSVGPTLDYLKSNSNEVQNRMNEDTHVPSGSAFQKYKNIFVPLNDFILRGTADRTQVCPNFPEH
jgi:predicted peptidase